MSAPEPNPPAIPDHGDLDARVRRAEEALGFTEHTTDQLSGEVGALHQAVARLTARLAALERRLASIESGPEPAEDDEEPGADPDDGGDGLAPG